MVKPWIRIDPTSVNTFAFRTTASKTFKLPDGQVVKFGTFHDEEEINIATIAITSDLKVLVYRQFRPGPEQIMDELPGGGSTKGYDPKKEATRELEEETGYKPGKMKFLGKLNYDAYSNTWRYYYLATDCIPNKSGQNLEPNEKFGNLEKISVDQLIANAKSGKMTDSGAILLAYDILLKLKEKSKL